MYEKSISFLYERVAKQSSIQSSLKDLFHYFVVCLYAICQIKYQNYLSFYLLFSHLFVRPCFYKLESLEVLLCWYRCHIFRKPCKITSYCTKFIQLYQIHYLLHLHLTEMGMKPKVTTCRCVVLIWLTCCVSERSNEKNWKHMTVKMFDHLDPVCIIPSNLNTRCMSVGLSLFI